MSIPPQPSRPTSPFQLTEGNDQNKVYYITDKRLGQTDVARVYEHSLLFRKELEQRDRMDNINYLMGWAEFNKNKYLKGRAVYHQSGDWWLLLLPGAPFGLRGTNSQPMAEAGASIYNYIIDTGLKPDIHQYNMLRQLLVFPYDFHHTIEMIETVDHLYRPKASQ